MTDPRIMFNPVLALNYDTKRGSTKNLKIQQRSALPIPAMETMAEFSCIFTLTLQSFEHVHLERCSTIHPDSAIRRYFSIK